MKGEGNEQSGSLLCITRRATGSNRFVLDFRYHKWQAHWLVRVARNVQNLLKCMCGEWQGEIHVLIISKKFGGDQK